MQRARASPGYLPADQPDSRSPAMDTGLWPILAKPLPCPVTLCIRWVMAERERRPDQKPTGDDPTSHFNLRTARGHRQSFGLTQTCEAKNCAALLELHVMATQSEVREESSITARLLT